MGKQGFKWDRRTVITNYRLRMVAYRQQLNMSQQELANSIYVTRSLINNIEHCYTYPKLNIAKDIAAALGAECDLELLFEEFSLYKDVTGEIIIKGDEGSVYYID